MRIISYRKIREAKVDKECPECTDCAKGLDRWYAIPRRAEVANFGDLRNLFTDVEKCRDTGLYIFYVCGNNVRIVADIHFNTGRLFLRYVMNHKVYDKGDWKREEREARNTRKLQ